jgi:putative hydrolase of the HAD superfamily
VTYTTYLFDLDGTLYSRDQLVAGLLAEQYEEFSRELSHVDKQSFVARVVELDDHGYQPKEAVYDRVAKQYRLTDSLQNRLLEHFWSRYDAHCQLPADTLNTLEQLKQDGRRLGIITNGQTARQSAKIDALNIREYFNEILISESEGLKKPHPEIFRRAITRIGCPVEETVFIGDHPVADIDGARSVGMAAIWKRVPYWDVSRKDVYVVDELSDILKLDRMGQEL